MPIADKPAPVDVAMNTYKILHEILRANPHIKKDPQRLGTLRYEIAKAGIMVRNRLMLIQKS